MAGKAGRSGRKKHDLRYEDTQAVINDVAPRAAQYIADVIDGKVRKFSSIRAELSKFAVEQVLGKARFKLELPPGAGGVNINMLVNLAQQQGLAPPPQQPPTDNMCLTCVTQEVTSVKHVLPENSGESG